LSSTLQTTESKPRAGTFAALRHRNFRLMWFSLLVSNSGTWLQSVAQDYVVYRLTGRALDLGFVNVVRALPLITLSFFGGTIADRMDRRKLLLATQTLFALAAAVLGFLVQTHAVQVWHVVVLSFLSSVLLAVDQPTRQALIPHLVPRKDLANAIALNSVTFTGAAAIGPAIAGPLVAAVGLPWGFYLNALSYGAVIWAVWALQLPPASRPRQTEPVVQAVLSGLRYVVASPALLLLVSLLTMFSLFAVPYQNLLPVFAARVFHGGVGTLGYLRAAPGAGALTGGFLLAHHAHFRRKGWLALGGGMGFCLALLAFCAIQWLPGALLALLLAGILSTVFTSTVQTLLQHLASDAMRGRVMSLFTVAVIGMWPLGTLPLSWAADRLGVAVATALGAGVAGLYMLAVALLARRRVERLQTEALRDEEAAST